LREGSGRTDKERERERERGEREEREKEREKSSGKHTREKYTSIPIESVSACSVRECDTDHHVEADSIAEYSAHCSQRQHVIPSAFLFLGFPREYVNLIRDHLLLRETLNPAIS